MAECLRQGRFDSAVRRPPAVTLLYWHNVLDRSHGIWDSALPRLGLEDFERRMRWISRRFQPLSMEEFLNGSGKWNKRRSLLITFDDGFRGVLEQAFPVMERFGWTGTVFLLDPPENDHRYGELMAVEVLEILFRLTKKEFLRGEGLGEQDSAARLELFRKNKTELRGLAPTARLHLLRNLEEELDVSLSEVLDFAEHHAKLYAKMNQMDADGLTASGWSLGAHTRNHPLLSTLTPDQVEREIGDGNRCAGTGGRKIFAYPYGDFSSKTLQQVEKGGYDFAFTTEPYRVRSLSHPYRIPRMSFGQLWKNFR